MLHTSNGSTKLTQFQQDLRVYPPILRKLAFFISNSTELMSFPEYCRASGLSYSSIRDAVIKARRRGNEYNDLLANLYSKKLSSQGPVAYKKLMEGVQKGSAKHLELYFRLIGDLRPEPRNGPETVVNSLTYVLAMPESIPIELAISEHNGAEDQGVIDVEGVKIPKNKTTVAKNKGRKLPARRPRNHKDKDFHYHISDLSAWISELL